MQIVKERDRIEDNNRENMGKVYTNMMKYLAAKIYNLNL